MDPQLRGHRALWRDTKLEGDSPSMKPEKAELCMPVCRPSSVLATPGCSALTVTPVPGKNRNTGVECWEDSSVVNESAAQAGGPESDAQNTGPNARQWWCMLAIPREC